ncbi:MAG: hypothetical protein ACFFE4_04390 [Candidatus Thorarchaeota archaeon]
MPYIIIGLGVFIFLFFPFYGIKLKYQVGSFFNTVFDYIGAISLTVGLVATFISVLGGLMGRSLNIKWFMIGITLLWVGCWCNDTVLDLFGAIIGPSRGNSGGYH